MENDTKHAKAPNHKWHDSQRGHQAIEKPKLGRRDTFIALAALFFSAVAALEGAPGFLEEVEERFRNRKQAIDREEELRDLLTTYLYPLNPDGNVQARVPLVPAMKDPWGPPKREFSGSGNAVAAAYASAFRSSDVQQIVQPIIDVNDDDAPVLIASHLVSEPAARYFGDPNSTRPNHRVRYQDVGGGFAANLRWAIYTPEDAKQTSKLELFQGSPMIRTEPLHFVSDLENPKLPQPVFARQGDLDYQLDDYLLITVLPRDSRFDRRMVSLAGLHKPGTLAAEHLLSDPNLTLEILNAIHEKVGGVPYYQALIKLKVDHTKEGLPRPTHLKLLDAQVIESVTRLE